MVVSILGCQFGNTIIYQKYLVTFMVGWAMIILYGTRYAYTYSFVNVVALEPRKINRSKADICPNALTRNKSIEKLHLRNITWTERQNYWVSVSFTATYLLMHFPSGVYSDKYGSRHVLSIGVLGSGLMCSVIPTVLLHFPWYVTAGARCLQGALQGFSMPALMSLSMQWLPKKQLGFLLSLGYGSGALGCAISAVTSYYFTIVLRYFEGLYYFWCAWSVIWYILFIHLIFSTPGTHPFVTKREKLALCADYGNRLMPKRIPWKGILSDSSIWGITASQIGHNFIVVTINLNLTAFLTDIIGVDLVNERYILVIPFMSQYISSVVSNYFGDLFITHGYMEPIYVRSIYTVVGNVLSSCFVLLTTFMGCNRVLNLSCFTAALITKAMIFAGLKANILDRTMHYAGTIAALENGIPALTEILSVQLVNQICWNRTVAEWRKVFWLGVASSIFTSMLFLMWCKGTRADWDYVESEEEIRLQKIAKKQKK